MFDANAISELKSSFLQIETYLLTTYSKCSSLVFYRDSLETPVQLSMQVVVVHKLLAQELCKGWWYTNVCQIQYLCSCVPSSLHNLLRWMVEQERFMQSTTQRRSSCETERVLLHHFGRQQTQNRVSSNALKVVGSINYHLKGCKQNQPSRDPDCCNEQEIC